MGPSSLSRRAFMLRMASAAIASSTLLSACTASPVAPGPTTSGSTSGTAPKAGRLQLPTYVPIQGPPPDVAGTDVVPPAYINYPKTPFKSVPTPPGKGGDVVVVSE